MGAGEPRDPRRRAVTAWLVTALWTALVLGLSSERFAAEATSAWIGAILDALLPGLDAGARAALHAVARKGAHAVEYAVLAALLFRALRLSVARARARAGLAAAAAFALALLVAVADEGHQARLSGRSGSAGDVALDGAGAGAGIVLAALWWRRGPREPAPPARAEGPAA